MDPSWGTWGPSRALQSFIPRPSINCSLHDSRAGNLQVLSLLSAIGAHHSPTQTQGFLIEIHPYKCCCAVFPNEINRIQLILAPFCILPTALCGESKCMSTHTYTQTHTHTHTHTHTRCSRALSGNHTSYLRHV